MFKHILRRHCYSYNLDRTALGKVPCPTAQADFSPMAVSRLEPGTS